MVRWKATITAVTSAVYEFDWTTSAGSANGAHLSVLLDSAELLAAAQFRDLRAPAMVLISAEATSAVHPLMVASQRRSRALRTPGVGLL